MRRPVSATDGSESGGIRLNSRCAADGISKTERPRVLRMQWRLVHRQCVSLALKGKSLDAGAANGAAVEANDFVGTIVVAASAGIA